MFEQMRFGQGFQHTQNLGTFLQCAACQLTDNKRMAKDLLIKEQSFQTFATRSEMLNPNQSVDQNHARLRGRRLRIRRSCFSVPPRFAKRRALSLAIRASSPRRTNEVFSFTPVSLAASCSRRIINIKRRSHMHQDALIMQMGSTRKITPGASGVSSDVRNSSAGYAITVGNLIRLP